MTLTQIKPLGLSKPVDLADNEQIRLGTSNDLQISHENNKNFIKSIAATNTEIWSDTFFIKDTDGVAILKGSKDGSVDLYYDNNVAIQTTNVGATIKDGDTNVTLRFETTQGQAGNITGIDDDNLIIQDNLGKDWLNMHKDGQVEIYHNGTKKLETKSYGVDIIGDLYITDSNKLLVGTSSDLQIYHDGTNTYLDNNTGQFNIDAASGNGIRFLVDGVYQCQVYTSGIDLPDSKKLRFGDSEDLQIYHDGSDSYIKDAGTGGLIINSNAFYLNNAGQTENMIKATENGAVELYYDHSKKFNTSANGATFTGNLHFDDGGSGVSANKISMGNGSDLQLYHDGSNSKIVDAGTGSLLLLSDSFKVQNGAGDEDMIRATQDGKVELYNNNHLRLETHTDGVSFRSTNHSTSKAHWSEGSLKPWANDTYDLGDASYNWRALHVYDGIYFSGNNTTATQLDDYEEGTWTPDIEGFNNVTYQSGERTGHYTKIGRLVYLDFYMRFESGGSTTSNGNAIKITGLPYTILNTNRTRGGGTTSYESINSSNDGGAGNISFYGSQGTTKFSTFVGTSAFVATNGHAQAGAYIIGTFIYHA